MRLIFLLLCACASIGAASVPLPAASPEAMLPGYAEPAQRWASVEDAVAARQCGERIEQVRDAAEQPELDREPARPDKPMLIAAVDKRIDGCPVMQMRNDVNDLRPLPQPAETGARLQPAR